MMNTEYDRDFIFDIDAYLIEAYPKMNMSTRRAICRLSLDELDSEGLEEVVDVVVANYAITKMNYRDPEEEEETE
mgnify:CR=1 FL=1